MYGDVEGDEANIEVLEDVSSELARTEYYWQIFCSIWSLISWLKTFYGRSVWWERLQPHGRDMGSIRRVQAHTLGCDLKETAAKLHYKIIFCNILYVVHKDALQKLIIKQYFRFYQFIY